MKYIVAIIFASILVASAFGCNIESPAIVTISPGQFRSDEFHLQVQLPDGWMAVEGPERLVTTGHLQGQVAFNSWGREDFWARAVRLPGSNDANSYRYGPEDVMSQIPEGGAYVALTLTQCPASFEQKPPENKTNDLSGLFQPHDWRQDSDTGTQFIAFHKWGESLELAVACHSDASDETVTQLNKLLLSWRFDGITVGFDADNPITSSREIAECDAVGIARQEVPTRISDNFVLANLQHEAGEPDRWSLTFPNVYVTLNELGWKEDENNHLIWSDDNSFTEGVPTDTYRNVTIYIDAMNGSIIGREASNGLFIGGSHAYSDC